MKTPYELPRAMALGDYYARRDREGVFHLVRFDGPYGVTVCDRAMGPTFRLVFDQDNAVAEHATCFWCVCRA